MEDRFKFRVWSEKQKKMYFWSDIIKMTNFGYALFIDNRALGEGLWFKQQSTGLKDKNGKLIYEGDVVEREDIQGKKRGVVVFDKEALQFRATNMSLYSLIHRAEVIGNIYENPELLESN